MEVTMALSAEMLILAGLAENPAAARGLLQDKLASGEAFETFRQMVQLHGGDLDYIDNPEKLPAASDIEDYRAQEEGFVTDADADMIGRACIILGAGRKVVTDPIDPAVGVSEIIKPGTEVQKGSTLIKIHSNDKEKTEEARSLLDKAFTISPDRPEPTILITETVKQESGR